MAENKDNRPHPAHLCPCGAEYNFTCRCSQKEIKAYQAGRTDGAVLVDLDRMISWLRLS